MSELVLHILRGADHLCFVHLALGNAYIVLNGVLDERSQSSAYNAASACGFRREPRHAAFTSLRKAETFICRDLDHVDRSAAAF